MDELEFSKAVEEELTDFYNELDDAAEELDIQVDLADDVIYIDLNSGEQYVINKHTPTMQIWLSSPISGASYFSFDNISDEWINEDDENLRDKINEELRSR